MSSMSVQDLVREGVALCRAGEWNEGVERLAAAAASKSSGEVSSLMYSYLGYGLAKYKNKRREGLALCEHAVKMEFFQPENQLNLARTMLLNGNRKRAVEAIERGLKLDGDHTELIQLRQEIGERRAPVLAFLGRDNFLNVTLGRLRHAAGSKSSR